MGGNIKINGFEPDHIEFRRVHRDTVRDHLLLFLLKMNSAYKNYNGEFLWEPNTIMDGDIYGGSSKYMFDKKNSEYLVRKHLPVLNDVDLLFPISEKERLYEFLNSPRGTHLDCIGVKKSTQIHALFKIVGLRWKNIQLDFKPVVYDGEMPNEWARFINPTSPDDIENGIKGIFHILLLLAILKSRTGKYRYVKNANNIRVMEYINEYVLSVDHGLRKNIKLVYEPGSPPLIKKIDRLEVCRKIPKSEYQYETDIQKIISVVFGTDDVLPDEVDSFCKTVDYLKKNGPDHKKYYKNIVLDDVVYHFQESINSKNLKNLPTERKEIALEYIIRHLS